MEAKIPKYARSKEELETFLGISRATLYRAGLVAGSPKPKRDGRLDVEAWRAHVEKHKPGLMDSDPSDESGATTPFDGHPSWIEALNAEKAMRARIARMKEQGQIVDRAFVRQCFIRAGHTLFAVLIRRLCNELPPQLAGMDAATIETKNRNALTEAKAEFDAQTAEWTEQVKG